MPSMMYARANCKPLRSSQLTLLQDHVLYESFNGIVLVEKEGKDIAACLGNKKAALLVNHGLLTVGRTVEEAVFWFVSLDKCCHAQLMADAAAGGRGGETVKIGEEEARYTYKTVGKCTRNFLAEVLRLTLHRNTDGWLVFSQTTV